MAVEDIPLADLRQGDRGALEKVVRAHAGTLLRAALAMGFREDDAEELVQDSFVAFMEAVGRFEGRSSLKTFLIGILYNKGRELMRRYGKEAATDDVEEVFNSHFDGRRHWLSDLPKGPEQAALDDELARLVAACAEGLAESQRLAFFLKEVDGASSEEICNVLEVSDTNLRVLLFRARLRLRECLEKSWGKG